MGLVLGLVVRVWGLERFEGILGRDLGLLGRDLVENCLFVEV